MENFFEPRTVGQQVVVGAPAFCDFTTIQAAIDSLTGSSPVEIIILAGVYPETIKLYRDNVTLTGLGEVRITESLGALDLDKTGVALGTFRTATVFINAQNITLNHLTIENAAGQGRDVGQAVALYCEGDQIEIVHCRLLAHQDTLCLGPLPELNKEGVAMPNAFKKRKFAQQRAYVSESYIEGTVDFIFGGGQAFIDCCEIFSKAKDESAPNFISAPCTVAGAAGLKFDHCFVHGDHAYYLGRPWRPYGEATFTHCCFDSFLAAAGFDEWGKAENRQTARFTEINNRYAQPATRAPWINFS